MKKAATSLSAKRIASAVVSLHFLALFLFAVLLASLNLENDSGNDSDAVFVDHIAEQSGLMELFVFRYDAAEDGFKKLIETDLQILANSGVEAILPREIGIAPNRSAILLIDNIVGAEELPELRKCGRPMLILSALSEEDEKLIKTIRALDNDPMFEIGLSIDPCGSMIKAFGELNDMRIEFYNRFGTAPKLCVLKEHYAPLAETVLSNCKNKSDPILLLMPGKGRNTIARPFSSFADLTYVLREPSIGIESILDDQPQSIVG